MLPSRKQFRFRVTPSDRQIWAIGMVAVQWSGFETYMEITATALLADEPDTRQRFQQTRSMQLRLDMLQSAVDDRMAPPYRERFLSLIREARDCQQMRDRIIHGAWSGTGNDPIQDPVADAVFNWLKPRHPFEWKLDYGRIKSVAQRIDSLLYDWFSATFSDLPKGELFIMSEAVRHKMRK